MRRAQAVLIVIALTATIEARAGTVFIDDFANGVVLNSKYTPGFWSQVIGSGSANALTESGGKLTLTVGDDDGSNDANYSSVRIISAFSADYNFFSRQQTYSVRGVSFDDHGNGIPDSKQQLRFALIGDSNNSYSASNAVCVELTPSGSILFGAQKNGTNQHPEDIGTKETFNVGADQTYGFDLTIGPGGSDTEQEYRLEVYTGAVPVSAGVASGTLSLDRATWRNGTGDSRLLLWSQEDNVMGGNDYYDATVSSLTVVDTGELLYNAGFEWGNTTAWDQFGGGNIAIESSTVYDGSYACRLYNRDQAYKSIRRDLDSVMTTGETYTVSIWVRLASGGPSTISLKAKLTDADHPTGTYPGIASATVSSSGWTKLEGQYTHTYAAPLVDLHLYLNGAANVELYVDEASVSLYEPPGGTIFFFH